MLSYQWNHQAIVSRIYDGLTAKGIPCWMDIKGGMSGSINEAMAEGVENAAAICCFMTEAYQNSANCKKELQYAETCGVEIVPCMMERDWKASSWLGIATAGLLWQDFRSEDKIEKGIESLSGELLKRCPDLKNPKSSEIQKDKKPTETPKFSTNLPNGQNRIFLSDQKRVLASHPGQAAQKRAEIISENYAEVVLPRQNISAIPVAVKQIALKIGTGDLVLEVDQGDEQARWRPENLGKFNFPEHGRISIMSWHGVPSQRWYWKDYGNDMCSLSPQGHPEMCLEVCDDGKLKLTRKVHNKQSQKFYMKFSNQKGCLDFDFNESAKLIQNCNKSIVMTEAGKGIMNDHGDPGLKAPQGMQLHDWPFPVDVSKMQHSMNWVLKKQGNVFQMLIVLGGEKFYAWDAIPNYGCGGLHLWELHNGPNQSWTLEHRGDGWYRFISQGNKAFALNASPENCEGWDGTKMFNRLRVLTKSNSTYFYLAGCQVWNDAKQFLGYMNPSLL